MSYVEELARALTAVGIRGRRRRRILAEITDHLACDPQSDLGPPDELARQWADQLGTVRARHAAQGTFAALAAAGALLAAALVAHNLYFTSFPRLHPASRPLADLGLGLVALGSQLAFVCGVLAAIRALRYRRAQVVSRREATLIARRAGLGLAAGLGCMLGLALLGLEYQRTLPGWWSSLALWAAAVGAGALIAALPLVASSAAIRPVAPGSAGDLFDDLGAIVPPVLRGREWLLAGIVSGGVGALIVLGGVAGDDPFDGVARGAAEALACLGGFGLLGRYLGLRRSPQG
jgi:hypothetical protein